MPFNRSITSARMASLSPTKSNPATSVRSVGGMNACAVSRCGCEDNDIASGDGNEKPALLSNGLPDNATKREFNISLGKQALLMTIGARRMLRGPVRLGPTMPLFWMPMAMDCVSPNPCVGEWQPAQVLSLFSPVIVSNHNKRPHRPASGRGDGQAWLRVWTRSGREACPEDTASNC